MAKRLERCCRLGAKQPVIDRAVYSTKRVGSVLLAESQSVLSQLGSVLLGSRSHFADSAVCLLVLHIQENRPV